MANIRTEIGNPLSILCTDRGGEYLSHEFTAFCDENGIERHLTQAHIPQQNAATALSWNVHAAYRHIATYLFFYGARQYQRPIIL